MNALCFALLPLVASGAVLPRQLDGGLGGLFEPVPVESVEELPPEIFPEAKRTVTRWGPYKMVGSEEPKPEGSMPSMDPNGQSFISRWNEGLCHDCTVLGGIITLQLEDGSPAMDDDVYIHHILTFDTDKATDDFVSMCPTENGQPSEGGIGGIIGGIGEGLSVTPFIGVGEDNKNEYKLYTTEDKPAASGYHIGPEDSFIAQSDIVNYNAEPRDVFITLDMEFVDGIRGEDAYSTLLRVTGCGDTEIKTDPNGPANTTSLKYPILTDGNIVSARGHLHTGGVAMILYHNEEQVCVSEAEYSGDLNGVEIIQSMSDCNDGTQVKKGDTLSMTAIYDLAAHPPMEGGGHGGHGGHGGGGHSNSSSDDGGMMGGMGGEMGMWSIIFAPTGGAGGEGEESGGSGSLLGGLFD